MQYPLGEDMGVLSKTGKRQSEFTLEAVVGGRVTAEDIKISSQTLLLQGDVARECKRPHLAENFERASELVDIPDELILKIYGMMRPYRSTKAELLAMADMLLSKYNAHKCAALLTDAAHVYSERGVLK